MAAAYAHANGIRPEDFCMLAEVAKVHCATCGMPFHAPSAFVQLRREDGLAFFCPQAHSNVFRPSELTKAKTTIANLELRLRSAESSREYWRQEYLAQGRRTAALRGVITKLKSRRARKSGAA